MPPIPIVLYCSADDVRSLVQAASKKSIISDSELLTNISKAQADVDSGLSTMYDVPFSNITTHPKGIPEKIRWLTAEKAGCIVHTKIYDEGQPNQTDAGKTCHDRVEAQLDRIRRCLEGLTYTDGSNVPRIGDCPDDSPGSGSDYVPIMSNTINDRYIFDTYDIKDTEYYEY